jgi:COP9 signalosome complex subunit 12
MSQMEKQADAAQNLMKGYIARERGIVVLSKGGAFPGTGV